MIISKNLKCTNCGQILIKIEGNSTFEIPNDMTIGCLKCNLVTFSPKEIQEICGLNQSNLENEGN